MTAALILTGAPGSGKTSVLEELCTMLEVDDVRFGAIESEQLARGWPPLPLAGCLRQLAAIVALQREAGRDTLLVVATTETETELRAVIDAVDAERVLVVCLSAPPEVAAARVAAREPDAWPGKQNLIRHARELATAIPLIPGLDVVLGTSDRGAGDVAAELRSLLIRRGIVAPIPPGRSRRRTIDTV
jgi:hypothetical protein